MKRVAYKVEKFGDHRERRSFSVSRNTMELQDLLEIQKKCDIIICKLNNKNKSKDNINYIITFREPKEAENLVSKNNLLSPNCFQTEKIN